MSVRVRFAPSPTGFLHVGGLRTALYNYLFAKKNNGKCILRIEDTDRTRLVENAAENLVENLSWAGVEFDESPFKGGDFGPYVQSERLELYQTYVNDLIDKDWAYYAFDTSEELEEMRKKQMEAKKDPKYERGSMTNQITLGAEETKNRLERGDKYVIRLKVPEKEVRFHDVIRGEIKVNGNDIDDQILLKSDGYPTYHLANVVDDHLMQISHIIRGEEWLPSTPKHVLLYEAFGWEVPEFAHLPLLLNEKKAKLSKRHGDVAVEDFRSKGYLKDAFVNFIALLGWNPSGDREIYDMDELISNFNLEKVNKGGAVFNREKLDWMQAQYLKKSPSEPLAEMLAPHVKEKGWEGFSLDYLKQVVELFKERVTFVDEIVENAPYMFEDPEEYEEKYYNKRWKDDSEDIIRPLIEKFRETDDFSHENTHSITKAYVDESGNKFGVVIHPLRLMITGRSVGAGMFETMEVLGKEVCIRRMEKFLERLKNDEIQTY
mgnify:CR=1 FL=1